MSAKPKWIKEVPLSDFEVVLVMTKGLRKICSAYPNAKPVAEIEDILAQVQAHYLNTEPTLRNPAKGIDL